MKTQPLPIVVLVSGRGSNLQALIDAQTTGGLSIEIGAVVSDQPQAFALERARQARIPTIVLNRKDHRTRMDFDQTLFSQIAEFQPELIILAGFMRVLGHEIVSTWAGKIINIHPSLLPKYPGLHTHQRALDAQDIEHGASIHYVTSELDGGPIISQTRIAIQPGDTAETLAQRLLPLEHHLLCATVQLMAERRIRWDNQRRLVLFDDKPLTDPLAVTQEGLNKSKTGIPA